MLEFELIRLKEFRNSYGNIPTESNKKDGITKVRIIEY
jgi:hypothetical protein